MLLLAVPDGCDGDEGGGDGALEETKEEADGGESGVVLRCGEAKADDTPDDSLFPKVRKVSSVFLFGLIAADLHSAPDKLGQGEPAHEIDERILGHELADIENRARP